MEKLELTYFCWDCGRPCINYFFNPKCKKSYERKKQQILTKRCGKRENYGVKGV